jgi:hypothetical protein
MIKVMRGLGINSELLYVLSMGSIVASIAAWAQSRSRQDKASAERWGIFVGLWAPTFVGLANALKTDER